MKHSFLTLLFLAGLMTLSGCGGGSDDNTNSDSSSPVNQNDNTNSLDSGKITKPQPSNPTTDVSPITFNPVTQNVTCDPDTYILQNFAIDSKYATEGDIIAKCKNLGGFSIVEYGLKEGVDTLDIDQLIKQEYSYGNTSLGSGYVLDEYDYKAGTIHHIEHYTTKMGGEAQDLDCVETFTSILPTTISSTPEIEDLLEWEGDASTLVSTTCPDSYYDDNNTLDDLTQYQNITGTFIQKVNYTLTDANNKKHLIYEEIQINSQ